MLDVSSPTVSFFGQNSGRPTTHSAPVTAPARLPSPPMTAIDTTESESSTRKNWLVKPMVWTVPPSSAPPRPATKPPSANAMSLARVGETVNAAAPGFVLAYADDHAPDAGAPQVPDEEQHERRARRARSSSTRGCGA